MSNVITLPTGSSRNKIESLASQVQQATQEIQIIKESNLSGGNITRPANLLKNPTFLSNYDFTGFNHWPQYSKVNKNAKFSFFNGIGKPFAPNWSMEVAEGYHCNVWLAPWVINEELSNVVVFGDTSQTEGKAVIFQPMSFYQQGSKTYAYIKVVNFVSFPTATVKFGIGVLNSEGNIESVLASKTENLDTTDIAKEFWLELPNDISTVSNEYRKSLVFFIEKSLGGLLNVCSAGAYVGEYGLVPELSKAECGELKIFRVPKKINSNSPKFPLSFQYLNYTPEKHFSFFIRDSIGKPKQSHVEFSFNSETYEIEMTGVSSSSEDKVWGIFSELTEMNYFSSGLI